MRPCHPHNQPEKRACLGAIIPIINPIKGLFRGYNPQNQSYKRAFLRGDRVEQPILAPSPDDQPTRTRSSMR